MSADVRERPDHYFHRWEVPVSADEMAQFENALETFATNTRDFQEFNLHLKDNVQRMSLGFGDLTEALKEHLRALGPRS